MPSAEIEMIKKLALQATQIQMNRTWSDATKSEFKPKTAKKK
jgi:hypothetical protein